VVGCAGGIAGVGYVKCQVLLLDGMWDSRPGHSTHDHGCGQERRHDGQHRCFICGREWGDRLVGDR